MSDTVESLRRQIDGAGDLQSVVRAMKALAASSIGQYQKSARAVADYHATIELGLQACVRRGEWVASPQGHGPLASVGDIVAIVFGSDQGLVGQFNDVVADYAVKTLAALPARAHVMVVGARAHARLVEAGLDPIELFVVPGSVRAIAPLVGRLEIEIQALRSRDGADGLWVFYNRALLGARYEPVGERLLPFDGHWRDGLIAMRWPTACIPEVLDRGDVTLRALIREFLFITLFLACSESLASENASRLAAMQRAEKNITDLLETLNNSFHQLRQSAIDEELFDLLSGFEALGGARK
jgi:F-type H+-transporting ATPase subunit gamma